MDAENLLRDGVSYEDFAVWFDLGPLTSHICWQSEVCATHYHLFAINLYYKLQTDRPP